MWILGGGAAHSPYNGSQNDVVYFEDTHTDSNRKSYGGNTIIVVEDTHFKPKR